MRESTVVLIVLVLALLSICIVLYLENQSLMHEINELKRTIALLEANVSGCNVSQVYLDMLDQELKSCREWVSILKKKVATMSRKMKFLEGLSEGIKEHDLETTRLLEYLDMLEEKYYDLERKYEAIRWEYEYKLNAIYKGYTDLVKQLEKVERIVNLRTFMPDGKMLIDYDHRLVRELTKHALDGCDSGLQCVKRLGSYILKRIKYAPDHGTLVISLVPLGAIRYMVSWGFYDNFFQKASETIVRGYGDCDDLSVLMTAMVLAYKKYYGGKDVVDSFVVVAGNNFIAHAYSITILRNGKAVIFYTVEYGMIVTDIQKIVDYIRNDGYNTLYVIMKHDHTKFYFDGRKLSLLQKFILENYGKYVRS